VQASLSTIHRKEAWDVVVAAEEVSEIKQSTDVILSSCHPRCSARRLVQGVLACPVTR